LKAGGDGILTGEFCPVTFGGGLWWVEELSCLGIVSKHSIEKLAAFAVMLLPEIIIGGKG